VVELNGVKTIFPSTVCLILFNWFSQKRTFPSGYA